MTDQKKRSRLQENLLNLYLRLNGYFVTGFIVHSPEQGKNRAEIDALAIRHPYNYEPERLVRPSPYLETSSEFIDLLICEVKSGGQQLHFNEALRNSHQAIASVLRWAGLFQEHKLGDIVADIQPLLQPCATPRQETLYVATPDGVRIRPILCSPDRWVKRNNQPWFISGSEIFNFLYDCFCPKTHRSLCSTRYDFEAWGEVYEPIVKFFKNNSRCNTIRDIYRHFDI